MQSSGLYNEDSVLHVTGVEYLRIALGTWAVLTIFWLMTLLLVSDSEKRRRSLHRLTIWLLLGGIEALLVSFPSPHFWLLAYLIALGACLREINDLQSNTQLGLVISIVVLLATGYFIPAFAFGLWIFGAVGLFGLPARLSVSRLAPLFIVLCYGSPLVVLSGVNLEEVINLGPLVGCLLLAGHVVDITSGFAGKLGGANPLPKLSPSKTWFGFVGGLVGSIAFFAGVMWHTDQFSLLALCFAASLLWLLTTAGDLVGSKFKRIAGAKDFSHILGPHGGIGDRLDSLAPTLTVGWSAALGAEIVFR